MTAMPQDDQAVATYQARFDALITRIRGLSRTYPSLRDVADELARLRRDLSGLEGRPLGVVPEPDRKWNDGSARRGLQRAPGGRGFMTPPAGMRRCNGHDDGEGAMLPVGQFKVKNPRTGQLTSWCTECTKKYQRDRYARVGYKIVTVDVLEGDDCIGHACPECGGKFAVGDRVQGENVRHEKCPL